MQRIQSYVRPFVGSWTFYRFALSVMIPVTVQQLINNLFNMADNLMMGHLNVEGLAMSAITVANKPYIIFSGVVFGLSGAGGLMMSQYFGANDRKTCQGLFSLQMLLGVGNAVLFVSVLFLFPERVMRLFVADERTVEMGIRYLRIICISYIPAAFSGTCVFSMRALGRNRISMVVSVATMGANLAFDYMLIFGKMGLPAMGVEGAAWGTLIARTLEMGFYLILLWRKWLFFSLDFLAYRHLPGRAVKTFSRKAVPLIANELLWTVGMSVYFWCYARIDETALPAITIAEQCGQIAMALTMGTSSAISVLIGTELGVNHFRLARENCKKLFSLVVIIGIVGFALNIVLGFALPMAFQLSEGLRRLASMATMAMAVFAPLGCVYSFCYFCLRAGGDMRSTMLIDSGYMWLVPVPLSIVIALTMPGKLPIVFAILLVQGLTNAKAVIALLTLKKGKWVRNITVTDH